MKHLTILFLGFSFFVATLAWAQSVPEPTTPQKSLNDTEATTANGDKPKMKKPKKPEDLDVFSRKASGKLKTDCSARNPQRL